MALLTQSPSQILFQCQERITKSIQKKSVKKTKHCINQLKLLQRNVLTSSHIQMVHYYMQTLRSLNEWGRCITISNITLTLGSFFLYFLTFTVFLSIQGLLMILMKMKRMTKVLKAVKILNHMVLMEPTVNGAVLKLKKFLLTLKESEEIKLTGMCLMEQITVHQKMTTANGTIFFLQNSVLYF